MPGNNNSNSEQYKLITLDNLDTYKDHIEEKNIQVTRDEYTNLPSTKLTDGKSYFITDEGVVIKNGTEYGGVSGGNTTYTLSAGTGTDANKIILTPSSGTPDKVTVPYATNSGTVNGKTVEANVPSGAVFTDTTYGLTADTTNNKITLTPSTGSAQSITVPYATSAGNAGTVNSHTVAKDVPSDAKFTDTTYSNATTAVAGLMSTSDKSKLDGVASGAEVNQNAFSNIVANGTTVSADTKTDTLTIEAGSNISITGDATNDKITISATDTTYSDATTASHGLMSTSDKIKLNGISSGAEVNQNAFSNIKVGDTTVAADTKTDTLELVAGTNITLTPDATNDKVTITSKDTTYSANNGVGLSGTTFYNSGVRSIAQGTSNGTINVNTNGSTANVAVKGLGSAAYTPSTDYIAASLKGANNGVAELDSTGKVPSSQLPSFVDDVLEYNSSSDFPLTGESGKIYIAKDTNKTYRWSGSAYVEISESLALGETSSTAYRGDRGKTAYDHSQTTGNPHGTTKANVGLGNVANIDQSKAIKSITRSGTTFTATALDGTTSSFTQQDNNTTYGANNGVGLSGTTFYNTGVRAIAEGTTAGTINVNTNGSTADVAVKDAGKAIKSITRSGTTFTATAIDGSTTSFTQQDNNTTYTGANGVSLSGTTFSNSGVRSVAAGGSNGTINVNTNGSTANIAVTGLKALAYKDSLGKSDVGLGSVANIDQSKAIKSITRSGTTFTATALDGTTSSFTQQDNNTTYSNATTAASGLMSASDKTKLNGIASGAEVNQNAFSNVVVGSTTIAADGKTDTLTLVAGSNVTLTPDATNDKITIAATDTNTWRGIQNNLTSDSTSDSLSAAQGKALANGSARDSTKLALAGGTLTGAVEFNNGKMPLSAGKITGLTAGASRVYGDGIAISNPTTANDVGFIRVTGTGESDTVLEICTGDDGGGSTAETIAVRQYNTSNAIAKEAKLLDPNGNTTFPGTVTAASFSGSIASATGLTKSQVTTALGYTPPTTNTTYTGSNGITLSGTNFTNSGVRAVATGGSNGTINVNTNGSTADVAVKGLGAMAYKASVSKSDVGLGNVANLDQSKAIKSITRSGTTFTATAIDGTTSSFTQQDNNTTYAAGTGITVSGTNNAINVTYGSAANTACQGNDSRLSNARQVIDNVLSNQDLNNITTPGFYSAGGGNTVANKPSGVDHFGLVVVHGASGSYYIQIIYAPNTAKSYRRYCTGNTTSWSAWVEDATKTDISTLQSNFQAGVDSVYNAIVARGTTPASKSLSDVVTGIGNIQTTHTGTYKPTTRASNCDMGVTHSYRYVNTTSVPNSNSGTYDITSNGIKDMGATNDKRYANVNVPNSNSGTYTPTTKSIFDMGATNDKRYVDTRSVANVNSGTYAVTTNGVKDMGTDNTQRYVNVSVPNSNSGTASYDSNGIKDMGATNSYRYVNINVPHPTHTTTYTPTSRASNNDMGATHSYRYVDTRSVPNSNSGTYTPAGNAIYDMGATNDKRYCDGRTAYTAGYNAKKAELTGTYTPTSRASNLDMGSNHTYRYVNTNSVPNSNSGTYGSVTSNGVKDMGVANTYRYCNINVPNSNSGTYTYASGSTGGTVDMGATNSYRYVNATNVYNKGKEDGASSVSAEWVTVTCCTRNNSTASWGTQYTKCPGMYYISYSSYSTPSEKEATKITLDPGYIYYLILSHSYSGQSYAFDPSRVSLTATISSPATIDSPKINLSQFNTELLRGYQISTKSCSSTVDLILTGSCNNGSMSVRGECFAIRMS